MIHLLQLSVEERTTSDKNLLASRQTNRASLIGLLSCQTHMLKKNNAGYTPFVCAIKRDDPYILQALYEYANKEDILEDKYHVDDDNDTENQFIRTLLSRTIEENAFDCLRLLICSVSLDTINEHGHSPLHEAVLHNRVNMVNFLLKKKADPNSVSEISSNESPLHYACRKNNEELVATLLKSKAFVKVRSTNERTPLHTACDTMQSEDIVCLLISNKASIDAKDVSHITPLMLAVKAGNGKAVALLLESNAHVMIRDIQHIRGTVAHWAATFNKVKILDTLLNHEPGLLYASTGDGWNYMHYACFNGSLTLTMLLLKKYDAENLLTNYSNDGRLPTHCLLVGTSHTKEQEEVLTALLTHKLTAINIPSLLYWKTNIELGKTLLEYAYDAKETLEKDIQAERTQQIKDQIRIQKDQIEVLIRIIMSYKLSSSTDSIRSLDSQEMNQDLNTNATYSTPNVPQRYVSQPLSGQDIFVYGESPHQQRPQTSQYGSLIIAKEMVDKSQY